MKRFIAALLAFMLLVSSAGCSGKKPAVSGTDAVSASDTSNKGNMIVNGDFSRNGEEDLHWVMYTESGGDGNRVIRDGALVVMVNKPGKVEYAVQTYYDGISLTRGAEYMFKFDISASVDKKVEARIQYNGGDYHAYIVDTIECGPEMKTVEMPFTMKMDTDPAPRVCFNCGRFDKDGEKDREFSPYEVVIDNISVICTKESTVEEEAGEVSRINLNQIGYLPGSAKIAVVRGDDIKSKDFFIEDQSGAKVYSGKLSAPVKNATAAETDYYADFSDLDAPGTYKVVIGDGDKSAPFAIGGDVYDDAYGDIVRMLYLQRCGCELDPAIAGEYAHPACHTDAYFHGTYKKIDVSGGWHDAGDYGRYVVSGAKAVMDLMMAYESDPALFNDASGIPESGNKVPDILDEARWELEWMLKMQAESGGVYHKVTGLNFPGVVMPEGEDWELYVCPISSTATGDFAAVMAHASAVYSFDKAFSARCLEAAKKAWEYLEANPFDGTGFVNPSDVVTGEYPDGQDIDERFWAASELLAVTGDKGYSDFIDSALTQIEESLADDDEENDLIIDNLGWANMGVYGMNAYLSADSGKTSAKTREAVLAMLTGYADNIVALSKKDGYFISMSENYPWGSNMNIMNNAMIMLIADRFAPDDQYRYYAEQHLNYIFGTNALGICFVTGYGTVSPQNPHHRPSQSVGKPMPGMLVGGVDSNLEDPYAQAVLAVAPPALCYVDNEQSYSCNEVCVYWNSPLIYVMTELLY